MAAMVGIDRGDHWAAAVGWRVVAEGGGMAGCYYTCGDTEC